MNCFRPVAFRRRSLSAWLLVAAFVFPIAALAQGVTTGSVTGIVIDAQKRPVVGASVVAIHVPSGTTYETVSREDGRFTMPGMRVGGPYTVVVSPAGGNAAGFQATTQENIMVNLGTATDLTFDVKPVVAEQITVVGEADPVFSSQRTGAATTISREMLGSLPTIGGRLNDMTRLTPQYGGTLSFGGADNRLNHITVDGSSFNNSFGLRNTPGDTSGVAPISLAAIEQVQVSMAPYDVRQGSFVGAAVNTVTRSGGNQLRGSFYHTFRDDSVVGTKAAGLAFNPGTFTFRNTGGWVSGPIRQNRTFFFGNYENEATTQPGTTFRANKGGEPVGGSVTRVLESDLIRIRDFMMTNFGYDTGGWEGYDFNIPAKRYIAKVDHNFNQNNRMVVRYNQLDSYTDQLISNSASLGAANGRRSNTLGLNFQNSNYTILENIKSIVGEWNSVFRGSMANNMIVGFTSQDESRGIADDPLFPFIDILEADRVYTSLGFEPFSPNNELRYKTFQFQNNLTWFRGKHNYTFGYTAERYESENVFNSGAQSVYVYNSLNDFFTDLEGYIANPNRTTSPVTLREFEVRYNNIPGQTKPVQLLKVFYTGGYMQDEWRVRNNLSLSLGLRMDVPFFGDTAFTNPNADGLTWRDENGQPTQYRTGDLPKANPLWSPRAGFNWDVRGDRSTQLRGGTGVFTGRPAYVWISNQVGNTGVLTGTDFNLTNRTDRPFHPDPSRYKPAATGLPAASYNLELIDPDFKFPQVWRSNIAVDQRLPGGFVGTLEFMYNRDVNGIYYTNENLPAAQSAFVGADNRPRWTSNRINNAPGNQVSTAVVLKNQDIGKSWNWAATLEKRFRAGFWLKTAYAYAKSENTIDPGSIATGSWQQNQISGDPNNPPVGISQFSPGHRWFMVGSYSRDFFRFGPTTLSVYWESRTMTDGRTTGQGSYVFSGDANGDGASSNDLIYIHRDQSEMNFVPFGAFTAAQQAAAWDAFIAQDPYLSSRRGQYAERNAVFLPFVHRADLSLSQDFSFGVGSRKHTVQFRWDVDNFTNLLNSDWGVGQRLVTNTLLTNPGVDSQGRMTYRLAAVNNQLISKTFERTSLIQDVYRMMFSIKYIF